MQLSKEWNFYLLSQKDDLFIVDEKTSYRKNVSDIIPFKTWGREAISYLCTYVFYKEEKLSKSVY